MGFVKGKKYFPFIYLFILYDLKDATFESKNFVL